MLSISRRKFLFGAMLFAVATDLRALVFGGTDYMSIAELARVCGMKYSTIEKDKAQRVYSKSVRIDFRVNRRDFTINGRVLWLGNAIAVSKGMLYLSKRDYLKTVVPILFPQKCGIPKPVKRIVIDAGHGGKDNGTQNKKLGLAEKNIALDLALKLGEMLKKRGFLVAYTRTKDIFIELGDRPKKAYSVGGDLFVSLHCNAAGSSVSGIESFALTPRYMSSTSSGSPLKIDSSEFAGNANDGWNEILAYYIQQTLTLATGSIDRGVKRARFKVLQDARMPSTLIECGFLSNLTEGKNLGNSKYRDRVAAAIADGISRYAAMSNRLRAAATKKK